VKSPMSTDGVIRVACEGLILLAILRLGTDGEGDVAVVSAQLRRYLSGKPRSGRLG
jgi:hypothetical protein